MGGIAVPLKSVNLGMHTLDWAGMGSPARENYLSHLQALGIHGIRTPFIWNDVLDPSNPNANSNAWAYATFVQECYQRGIECTALIHTFEPAGAARDQHLRDLTNWVYNNWGPDGVWWGAGGYAGDRAIVLYEIFNEPNDGSYSAAAYGNMVKPIYQDLRCPSGHNDARVRVICGGLRNRNTPEQWVEDLINSGNMYIDHFGVHPYPTNYATAGNTNAKAMMTNIQAKLNAHSATQIQLITEYAYPFTTDADQKNKYEEFRSWEAANIGVGLYMWFPAINGVAEGFSGTDCRLTTTSDWSSFHDRSVAAAFAYHGDWVLVMP